MAGWLALAVTTCESEFPGFEALHSFKVFGLHPRPSTEACEFSLRKLASTFNVTDPGILINEYNDGLHFAQKSSGLSMSSKL